MHKLASNRAFTLIEVILIIFILALLALLLPALSRHVRSSQLSACQYNLKQVSLAQLLWMNDHAENYLPAEVSTNRGGSLEYLKRGELWQHFRLLSNDVLGSPAVLACPADRRKPARSFGALTNLHLSYFVNGHAGPMSRSGPPDRPLDAPIKPVMFGDRNITNISGGTARILSATHTNSLSWNARMHNSGRKDSELCIGNIGFMDGSVSSLTTAELREAFRYDKSTNIVLP